MPVRIKPSVDTLVKRLFTSDDIASSITETKTFREHNVTIPLLHVTYAFVALRREFYLEMQQT